MYNTIKKCVGQIIYIMFLHNNIYIFFNYFVAEHKVYAVIERHASHFAEGNILYCCVLARVGGPLSFDWHRVIDIVFFIVFLF